MILIDNKEGLIGDFLGTVPAMQNLAEKEAIIVKSKQEVFDLFNIINKDKFASWGDVTFDKNPNIILNSKEAFEISCKYNCYMTSAFMIQAGFELPEKPPKAKLLIKGDFFNNGSRCDYYISPFARSLPEEQKWPQEKWLKLVNSMTQYRFGLLGNSKYDSEDYLRAPNVLPIFDKPFNMVCDLLLHSKGLISVVTGTSHLAFHLGKRNILLTSQTMAWGNNPDAIRIQKPIENITVEEVISKL